MRLMVWIVLTFSGRNLISDEFFSVLFFVCMFISVR